MTQQLGVEGANFIGGLGKAGPRNGDDYPRRRQHPD